MAGLNYYAKLPAYEMPDAPDVWKPISNALTDIRKGREADRHNDILQQQADIHQQTADQAAARDAQALEEKHQNQVAGIAQYIQGLPEDDPNRQKFWQGLVDHHPDMAPALKSSGVDPTDHINGPKYITSKIAGYQDEQKKALMEAQAGWYNQRGDAVKQNADTRRMKVYGDVVDRLGPNPDPAIYDRENQAGGLIHTAFNGPIPRDQWPKFYQQAKDRRNESNPDYQAMRDAGVPEASVRAMRDSDTLSRSLGPPKRGYMWEIDKDSGRPMQTLLAEKEDPKQKKIDNTAPFYLNRLDMASQVLGNSNMGKRIISSLPGGSAVYPELKEARDAAGHGIAALTAIVEGQRHANAMDVRMIGFFQPAPNDTDEMTRFKINEAQQFFKAWMSAKAAKRSDEYITTRFESALQKSYNKLLEKQGLKAPTLDQDKKSGTPQGMSNEELLRRLNE